jgi:hypothetical protein
MRARSCTKMLMKGNPSVLMPRSPSVGFMLCWDTWASPPPQDTRSRVSRVQGEWNSRKLQRSFPDPRSSTGTRGQPLEHLSVMLWLTPSDRPSLLGAVAIGMSYRTPSTASCLSKRRTSSRPLGEEGCPQDGDGTPSGCDGGAERLPADCLVRDRVSPHLDV